MQMQPVSQTHPLDIAMRLGPVPRHAVCLAMAVALACLALSQAFGLAIAKPQPFEAKLAPGTFLVASRQLHDPNFAKSVILIVAYDDHGAQGVVINRPSPFRVSKILPDLPPSKTPSPYIYLGGPVARTQMRLLVQTDAPGEGMQRVLDNLYLSGSLDILQQLMMQTDSRYRVFAGYAGWAPGQLESEIERGGWHVFDADVDAIFDPAPRSVWPRLIRQRDLKWM